MQAVTLMPDRHPGHVRGRISHPRGALPAFDPRHCLIHDLGILSTDPTDTAAHAMRARIQASPLLRKTLPIMVEAPVSRDQLPLSPLDSLQGACLGELGCPWSGSAGGRAAVGALAEFAGEDGRGLRVPRPAGR
jgi:hypothetical protein